MPVSHVARYHCHFYSRPRVGGDPKWVEKIANDEKFLLTPPRGGRRFTVSAIPPLSHISTHAPAWGATPDGSHAEHPDADFYSRPRVGGD